MSQRRVAITFDVDLVDHVGGADRGDELDSALPLLRPLLAPNGDLRATWFLRIDGQLATRFGAADVILRRHEARIAWLRAHGHEIGWHHHAYRHDGEAWRQEIDPAVVVPDVRFYGQLARAAGMKVARMGWGWHTNATMVALDALGFRVDSSAMPRPQYHWETSAKDWSRAPASPYHPSVADYQASDAPTLRLLEIPISTTAVAAPGDEGSVIRYLNPAYHPAVFQRALGQLAARDMLVTVTHPYELLPHAAAHPLLAFDGEAFRINVQALRSAGYAFATLSELAA